MGKALRPDWAKGTPIYFEPQRKAARSRIKTTASCSSPKSFLVLERRAERWTVGVPR